MTFPNKKQNLSRHSISNYDSFKPMIEIIVEIEKNRLSLSIFVNLVLRASHTSNMVKRINF